MKLPICLVLATLLSACIPIGIRGTSIGDAGAPRPVAAPPAGDTVTALPAFRAPHPRRV